MATRKKRTRIALELPKELRERLEARAAHEDRSLSASIRQLLVRALETMGKEKDRMMTREDILRQLAKTFVRGGEDPLFVRSSPETRSCIFCHEDMGYEWRAEMRFPLYRHTDACVMTEARMFSRKESTA